jgi:16S rRNA (adenine1518-N6/adenine1519-N6)-dimethyltransferase
MSDVRPKKHLGQHFLKDLSVAEKIVAGIDFDTTKELLEIGPGMGVLTDFLIKKEKLNLKIIDIDAESIEYLKKKYPSLQSNIIFGDFLKLNLAEEFGKELSIIGNFPYNISTQILFKIYENRHQVKEMTGMFQKEVAERVASKPGNKVYGILSPLIQAFYHVEYLFTVEPECFNPPPKVRSGVIRLRRNDIHTLPCDEELYFKIIKTAFNQRRKTMRNSLKSMGIVDIKDNPIFDKRPEQLSCEDFIELTTLITR